MNEDEDSKDDQAEKYEAQKLSKKDIATLKDKVILTFLPSVIITIFRQLSWF